MLLYITLLLMCVGRVFVNADCDVIKQENWNSLRPQPTYLKYLPRPVDLVVLLHTSTDTCDSEVTCQAEVQSIEEKHVGTYHYWEIGYNFLIGGNGNVYEGGGWIRSGRHTHGYNTRSIGIGFIGNFNTHFPTVAALNAAQALIKCGVRMGHIKSDYNLVGHNQLSKKTSPGTNIVSVMTQWPHWLEDTTKIKGIDYHYSS